MTSKKDLSERDICTKFITPALEQAGWDMQKQVREEVSFTASERITFCITNRIFRLRLSKLKTTSIR